MVVVAAGAGAADLVQSLIEKSCIVTVAMDNCSLPESGRMRLAKVSVVFAYMTCLRLGEKFGPRSDAPRTCRMIKSSAADCPSCEHWTDL